MADKERCFIVMPLTIPVDLKQTYRDSEEHFKHVLDCLFIPAVEKAGYIPVPPIAKGADLIHAEIIKNLENTKIVLCDMSSLNANVFFELGIRTALNKPVCIVKDELTIKVPFDTTIQNYHEYKSALDPWELPQEIDELVNHIKSSVERSKGENSLWKYFGFQSEGSPYKVDNDDSSKLDYIMYMVESLKDKDKPKAGDEESERHGQIFDFVHASMPPQTKLVTVSTSSGNVTIGYNGNLDAAFKKSLEHDILLRWAATTKFKDLN